VQARAKGRGETNHARDPRTAGRNVQRSLGINEIFSSCKKREKPLGGKKPFRVVDLAEKRWEQRLSISQVWVEMTLRELLRSEEVRASGRKPRHGDTEK